MATNTYVALDKVTVSIATNTVTFNSISGTYTDLRIVVKGTAASNSYCTLRFNGDTGSSYSNTEIVGDGSTANTYRNGSGVYAYSGSIYTSQTNNLIDILGYSNSTTFKSFTHRADNTGNSVKQSVGLWRSTAPITSITLGTGGATNFNVGTTFSLYGIKAWAAEATPKATGGYVYSDSTYWYHAFPYTGVFTPNQSITADILVVAGGGGAGAITGGNGNGGGGAGGFLAYTSQSLTATGYTCTVGAGGRGGILDSNSVAGTNSQFGALTASVGGGRGAHGGTAGNASGTGGSGGGGQGSNDSGFSLGSAGTASQGNAGGDGYLTGGGTNSPGGGGGGGAGAVGQKGKDGLGGDGGVGLYSTFTNSIGAATGLGHTISGNTYFAGGGGGSSSWSVGTAAGGFGGGGEGYYDPRSGQNAMVSTGGGGGAGRGTGTIGGNGGSGVVIVRYTKA